MAFRVKYISTGKHPEATDISNWSADSENKQFLRLQEVFSQIRVQKEFKIGQLNSHFEVANGRPAASSKEDSVTNVFLEILLIFSE